MKIAMGSRVDCERNENISRNCDEGDMNVLAKRKATRSPFSTRICVELNEHGKKWTINQNDWPRGAAKNINDMTADN